jgi:hypothetical protein
MMIQCFYISHNNDNGDLFFQQLQQEHSDEELVVGKISDNGIQLAWMIRLLHQNQLCNEPMLTLL